MNHIRPAIMLIVLFTLLTGLALPMLFVGIGNTVMPDQAGGSLITSHDGQIIGSSLLGQNFTTPRYFHPRPSATTDTDPKDSTKTIPSPYNAANSSGSNLAPTSKALIDRVAGDVKQAGGSSVPADAVTTSASGLDPDISPENAQSQASRVAAARAIPLTRVRALVAAQTVGRLFGLIGEPHVNVLALNMALDQDIHH